MTSSDPTGGAASDYVPAPPAADARSVRDPSTESSSHRAPARSLGAIQEEEIGEDEILDEITKEEPVTNVTNEEQRLLTASVATAGSEPAAPRPYRGAVWREVKKDKADDEVPDHLKSKITREVNKVIDSPGSSLKGTVESAIRVTEVSGTPAVPAPVVPKLGLAPAVLIRKRDMYEYDIKSPPVPKQQRRGSQDPGTSSSTPAPKLASNVRAGVASSGDSDFYVDSEMDSEADFRR